MEKSSVSPVNQSEMSIVSSHPIRAQYVTCSGLEMSEKSVADQVLGQGSSMERNTVVGRSQLSQVSSKQCHLLEVSSNNEPLSVLDSVGSSTGFINDSVVEIICQLRCSRSQ